MVATTDERLTCYDKLWRAHAVTRRAPGHPTVVYVDLHLLHEGSYLQAFELLQRAGIQVRRPDLTLATTDHFVPTDRARRLVDDFSAMPYVVQGLLDAARSQGITVRGPNDPDQGIVHVMAPEQGYTRPGMTIACGDSHTTTHGALGALAFGIGTTQVAHVLASQCLLLDKQRNLRITVSGTFAPAVTSKDLALHILATHGVEVGRGHAIEFAGDTIASMSIAQRMTLCNMAIEMGSRTAVVAPDDVTYEYLAQRPRMPSGQAFDALLNRWRSLPTDPGAVFDREISVRADQVAPMVTYGTTPAMAMPVDGVVPAGTPAAALHYMGLSAGERLLGKPVDTVFIGSCTNSRIEDLRAAAQLLRGRRVAATVRVSVVPGSQAVKRAAQAEGLDRVFLEAGAAWGEPSCSMCLGVNGDVAPPGVFTASTSNRNFEGRQGPRARTLLMSPLTAAATSIEGAVADPRRHRQVDR